jgi:hypothetical protein
MSDYSIEPVVKKARRQFPHLADDLEQEIRLAHWLATQKPVPEGKRFSPAHARMKGKYAGIDFVRKFQGQQDAPGRFYRAPTTPYVDDPFDDLSYGFRYETVPE